MAFNFLCVYLLQRVQPRPQQLHLLHLQLLLQQVIFKMFQTLFSSAFQSLDI